MVVDPTAHCQKCRWTPRAQHFAHQERTSVRLSPHCVSFPCQPLVLQVPVWETEQLADTGNLMVPPMSRTLGLRIVLLLQLSSFQNYRYEPPYPAAFHWEVVPGVLITGLFPEAVSQGHSDTY